MTKDKSGLGSDKISKLLFKMALPAILAQIVNLAYNMVDRMFIGRIPGIGALALTGVGLTFPLIILITAFAALVSMGAAPRASIMLGKGNKDEAEEILGNSFSSLLIVSIILTTVIIAFGEKILMTFGASPDTIGYALEYPIVSGLAPKVIRIF